MSNSLRTYGLELARLCMSMGFSRQEYWSGLPCPSPGDLPDPGIKFASLTSPSLAGGFFTTSAIWKTSAFHEGSIKLPSGSFQVNRLQAEKLLQKNPKNDLHHTLNSLNIGSSLYKHTLVIGLHPHLLYVHPTLNFMFKSRAKGSHLFHCVPGHRSMAGFICKPSEHPEKKRAFYKS